MKVIKIKSNKTFTGKDGKEHYYYNYFLVLDNGSRIAIKTCFPSKDNAKLDAICSYEK